MTDSPHRSLARRARRLIAGAAVAAAAMLPGASVEAAPVAAAPAPPDATTIEVTAAEVAASNAKVRMAYEALVVMWREDFARIGARFAAPRLARYRTAVRTACGVVQPGNAAYCPTENAIYFDDVFVAGQAKAAARDLGTDGDMAAIGVIAHEMGHAVALQLGFASPRTYDNEAVADCLAGAFARRAAEDGSLEEGDVEEAFHAMSRAGDPTPVLTGDPRRDRRALLRQAANGHGTREQRMRNFDAGLTAGAAACLPAMRALG
jgi:predicted metalloprotease